MERGFEDVTAKPAQTAGRLEMRIHGDNKEGKGDRWTILSATEASILAYELLLGAKQITYKH